MVQLKGSQCHLRIVRQGLVCVCVQNSVLFMELWLQVRTLRRPGPAYPLWLVHSTFGSTTHVSQ